MNVKEEYRKANRHEQKENFPQHIIIKTLNLQNKEKNKSCKEKGQDLSKVSHIKTRLDFSIGT